jgi:hypothetical protein
VVGLAVVHTEFVAETIGDLGTQFMIYSVTLKLQHSGVSSQRVYNDQRTASPRQAQASDADESNLSVVCASTGLQVGETICLLKAPRSKQWWKGYAQAEPTRRGIFPRDYVDQLHGSGRSIRHPPAPASAAPFETPGSSGGAVATSSSSDARRSAAAAAEAEVRPGTAAALSPPAVGAVAAAAVANGSPPANPFAAPAAPVATPSQSQWGSAEPAAAAADPAGGGGRSTIDSSGTPGDGMGVPSWSMAGTDTGGGGGSGGGGGDWLSDLSSRLGSLEGSFGEVDDAHGAAQDDV